MSVLLEDLPSLIRVAPSSERASLDVLVARLRASDAAVHERVLRELLPDVRWWTKSLLGDSSEVDDAVQEALCQLASALYRFEGRSSLRTLARKITVRTVLRHAQRARRSSHPPLMIDPAGGGQGPEQDALNRDTLRRVQSHVRTLAPKRRVAFVLCMLEGLTPTEAARDVGCSALAMRGRLYQARRDLADRLREDEHGASLQHPSTRGASS